MTKKSESNPSIDLLKQSRMDLAKLVALVFFGGIFYNHQIEVEKATEARFSDFKTAAERRDERMEKMQDAQNTLVNQLTEIKSDVKNLGSGVEHIQNSLTVLQPTQKPK